MGLLTSVISCLGKSESAAEPHDKPTMSKPKHLGSVMEVGDFRLDVSRRAATVLGKELNLSPTEFDVLLFLSSHPTNVVTNRTALMTIWRGQAVQRVEFLHLLLSLRRKIASASDSNAYLKTESMVLCRFDANGSDKS